MFFRPYSYVEATFLSKGSVFYIFEVTLKTLREEQIFIQSLVCAKHYAECWRGGSERSGVGPSGTRSQEEGQRGRCHLGGPRSEGSTGAGVAGAGPRAPALQVAILQREEGRPMRAGAARACGVVALKDAVRRGRPPLQSPPPLPVMFQLGGRWELRKPEGVEQRVVSVACSPRGSPSFAQ